MAKIVLTDVQVSIAGTDVSDHVKSVTLNVNSELQDNTAMGSTYRGKMGGLKDWDASIELFQDYAAGNIDSILFANIGASVAFSGKPTSGSVSTSNPNYNGNACLESYAPISGSVGDVAMTTAALKGNGALTRSTS